MGLAQIRVSGPSGSTFTTTSSLPHAICTDSCFHQQLAFRSPPKGSPNPCPIFETKQMPKKSALPSNLLSKCTRVHRPLIFSDSKCSRDSNTCQYQKAKRWEGCSPLYGTWVGVVRDQARERTWLWEGNDN